MSLDWIPDDDAARRRGGLPEMPDLASLLVAEGLTAEAAEALAAFDAENFRWSRLVAKGEMLAAILDRIGCGVDLSQFQALAALARIRCGLFGSGTEPTIGTLAEALGVDPSRASRVAADLVARGFARREVAQEDARRSVLALTPEGMALLDAFRHEKWRVLARVFRDWPVDEIATFARNLGAYTGRMREVLGELRADDPRAAPRPPD